MQKMQVLVRRPVALVLFLALLSVGTHAASIVLFTSQDAFQGRRGLPQLAYNFNGLPNGVPDNGQLDLGGLTIASGDVRVLDGGLNFGGPAGLTASSPSPLSFNFASDVFSFGTEIAPINGVGALNISIDGLTASFDVRQPGFIGFATDFPFRAFNATFVPSPVNSSVGMYFVIDNVVAHAVPEPATLMLLAASAGLAGLYRRRLKALGGRRDGERQAGDADPM